MRFLPSNPWRTAAEVLLAVAIVGFVVYDFSGPSAKPEAADVVLSFAANSASSEVSTSTSSRFDATVTGVTAANTFLVCGNTVAPTNPWQIGTTTAAQALVVSVDGSCAPAPAIMQVNASRNISTLAGIHVASGSWLSFIDVFFPGSQAGALSGPLVMDAGSYLETVIKPTLVPVSTATVQYNLLFATGPCPTFVGVNFPIVNCPFSATSTTGNYACAVSAVTLNNGTAGYSCNIYLTIVGAESLHGAPISFAFNKDCLSFSQVMFKAVIFQVTGVSSIEIVQWGCGSITVVFAVLGSNPALIAAATALINNAALCPAGALVTALGIICPPVPPALRNYYAIPYCNYYYCSTAIFNPSSSNPGLFALLTLLIIPVAILVGLLIWCCLPRCPVCEPMPVCPPAPCCPVEAPVVYYAEPYAMPCPDPCNTPAMAPTLGGY